MTHEALISIILPTYNGTRFLERAIQSCIDQTYPKWELIIVDDASTDDTPSVISLMEAKDKRIRSIRHYQNRKLPGALNTGFAASAGDFLTWTSDDNCYRPEALAKMLAFLKSSPDYDMVYADYTIIDGDSLPIQPISVGEPTTLVVRNIVGACFLYRRNVYEILGEYNESLFLAEDYDYWLRVLSQFKMFPLHEDLYLYRKHPRSLTQQQLKQILQATDKAVELNLPHMCSLDESRISRGYANLAYRAFHQHKIMPSFLYLCLALQHSPGYMIQSLMRSAKRELSAKNMELSRVTK